MKVMFTHRSGREQSMQRIHAEILRKLGRGTYMTRDMRAENIEHGEELTDLRAEYQAVVGKRAFHGWDAEQLREKIAQAGQGDEKL